MMDKLQIFFNHMLCDSLYGGNIVNIGIVFIGRFNSPIVFKVWIHNPLGVVRFSGDIGTLKPGQILFKVISNR